MGDLRAADRVRASRRDPAAHRGFDGTALARLGDCERPLRDVPSPATLAETAPARLESFDLARSRARLLVRVAREVATGRLDLHDVDHRHAWQRLRSIPGVGPWTVEMLALYGQGRFDQLRPETWAAQVRRTQPQRRRPAGACLRRGRALVLRALWALARAGGRARGRDLSRRSQARLVSVRADVVGLERRVGGQSQGTAKRAVDVIYFAQIHFSINIL